MSATTETGEEVRFIDKQALAMQLDIQDRALGFIPRDGASHDRLRAMMLSNGIQPETNSGSQEIVAMRDE